MKRRLNQLSSPVSKKSRDSKEYILPSNFLGIPTIPWEIIFDYVGCKYVVSLRLVCHFFLAMSRSIKDNWTLGDRYINDKGDSVTLDFIKWANFNGAKWDKSTAHTTAKLGRLDVLKWAMRKGYTTEIERKGERIKDTTMQQSIFFGAAEGAQIDVLKWAKDCGFDHGFHTGKYAAKEGHIHVLEWLDKNDITWDVGIFKEACLHGRLDVIKWAYKHGAEIPEYSFEEFSLAAQGGHRDIIDWLESNMDWVEYSIDGLACTFAYHAAKGGHLDTMKHFLRQSIVNLDCEYKSHTFCDPSTNVLAVAAIHGHIHILEYLKERGWKFPFEIEYLALYNGQLATLRWLKENCNLRLANGNPIVFVQCLFSTIGLMKLSENTKGCFDSLMWLEDNGHTLPDITLELAVNHGYLEPLRLRKEKGCEFKDEFALIRAAALYGHVHILSWLKENGSMFKQSSDTCLYERIMAKCISLWNRAAYGGHIRVFKWLKSNNLPYKKSSCIRNAQQKEHHDAIAWLEENI